MAGIHYKTASALAALALLAAGCSSSGSKGGGGLYGGGGGSSSNSAAASSSTTSVASTATSQPAPAAGIAVSAIEQEFSIQLSRQTFTAGTYTFTVQNKGTFQHNLTIEGPGVDRKSSPTLAAGTSGAVTVTLAKGSYELWCSVDSHKDKGMDLMITVG